MSALPALLIGFSVVSAVVPAAPQSAILVQETGSAAPARMFEDAARFWANGEPDEAVFWLYAAQLRFRSHLAADAGGDPSGAPALFDALMESVGRPINEYAFGDIPALQRTIDAVLAWDEANRDVSLPAASHAATRDGLARLRDRIGRDAASIRAERQRNGLPNR